VNRSVSPPGWPCSATPVTGMPRGRGALGRWLPELIALDAAVAPPDPALVKTCHRDLNTENVLRAADGRIIVMDGENSGPARAGTGRDHLRPRRGRNTAGCPGRVRRLPTGRRTSTAEQDCRLRHGGRRAGPPPAVLQSARPRPRRVPGEQSPLPQTARPHAPPAAHHVPHRLPSRPPRSIGTPAADGTLVPSVINGSPDRTDGRQDLRTRATEPAVRQAPPAARHARR